LSEGDSVPFLNGMMVWSNAAGVARAILFLQDISPENLVSQLKITLSSMPGLSINSKVLN
jgi:hypothetical protein